VSCRHSPCVGPISSLTGAQHPVTNWLDSALILLDAVSVFVLYNSAELLISWVDLLLSLAKRSPCYLGSQQQFMGTFNCAAFCSDPNLPRSF
jgi:hypothetical protein